ncbi:helix-turn-helix transcriptional regulator [Streptomyces misionensis]|uniref:helix-turn-helix transcriptional regulator n=1 Tax=Streptomyces misionensis TaxID=67331 RepID=UPI003BB0EF78
MLRRLRENAGLTQDELERRAGVSVSTIRGLETGKRGNPRMTTAAGRRARPAPRGARGVTPCRRPGAPGRRHGRRQRGGGGRGASVRSGHGAACGAGAGAGGAGRAGRRAPGSRC